MDWKVSIGGWKAAAASATTVLVMASGLAVANAADSGLAALAVSSKADRSAARNLAGSTLAGNAYIFLNRDNATSVSFYLDGSSTPSAVEKLAPFDFASTAADGTAKPLDTKKLADGSHSVRAVLKTNTRTRTFTASFAVKNAVTPLPTTVKPTTTTAKPTTTTAAPGTTLPPTTLPPTTVTTVKPTTTTTAAPGTLPKNCAPNPHVCGYPDATNTGWQHTGVTLKPSGSITVTQNGAVIDGLDISGNITVQANNVTIKRSRITSSDYYPIRYDETYTGLVVEDTEIHGLSALVTAGMSFNNYTARRVHIWGTVDGFKGHSNVVVEDSYVHDLSRDSQTHNDGFQCGCSGNVTIRHNTFMLTTADGGLFFKSEDGGPASNILIDNNLLSGAGWTIDIQPIPLGTNRTIQNNRFARNSGYGPAALGAQYTWTNNYYDDNLAPVNP